MTTADSSSFVLVLVSYYQDTIHGIEQLVASFEAETGFVHDSVIVIDNSGKLTQQGISNVGRFSVHKGSNTYWEFSGWVEGMVLAGTLGAPRLITLLNDSYARNWTITEASRGIIAGMYSAAQKGKVAGWRDNFSFLRKPYFSSRPNSRVVICGQAMAGQLQASIQHAIDQYAERHASGAALFSPDEENILERWVKSQPGRWPKDALQSRLARIFIEHHVFDGIELRNLESFPCGLVGRLVYSLKRRKFQERR
ncbi:hypothetical protein BSY18_3073 [Blastomonas sp. RAC04]|uniref:hypothetical protein n=1 Tax=Blastomonas sp. RAC04 TaxID=1842535 RepID=UPI00083E33F9|nr:hypothetical protein [Blastomonas sp. RAC04]AOG01197.1 hypothetical protein BSY18_3073 [Blastomonas sp. RAC04]